MVWLNILIQSRNDSKILRHEFSQENQHVVDTIANFVCESIPDQGTRFVINRRGKIISNKDTFSDLNFSFNEIIRVHFIPSENLVANEDSIDCIKARRELVFSNPVALYKCLLRIKSEKNFNALLAKFPELKNSKLSVRALLNDQLIHSMLNLKENFDFFHSKHQVLLKVLLRLKELYPEEYTRLLSGPEEVMTIFKRDYTVDPVLNANPGHLMADANQEELRNVHLSTMTMDPTSIAASILPSSRSSTAAAGSSSRSNLQTNGQVISSSFLRSALNAASGPRQDQSLSEPMDTSSSEENNSDETLRQKYKTQIEQLVSMGLPYNTAMLNVLEATNGSIELAMSILFN